jgi:DNA-directed RNA polymerase specialized sigma24 family protein
MPFRTIKLPVNQVTDELVQEWHGEAAAGDPASMRKLFLWVYYEANRYYRIKSREHERLTRQDAEDLATQFVIEFESGWRDVRSVARYTRVVLKRNLYRHLRAVSAGPTTVSLDLLDTKDHAVSQVHAPWMALSDSTYEFYSILCMEYFDLPPLTKLVVNARLQQPPTPYASICDALGINEATARVQTNRFLKRVRKRLEQQREKPPTDR